MLVYVTNPSGLRVSLAISHFEWQLTAQTLHEAEFHRNNTAIVMPISGVWRGLRTSSTQVHLRRCLPHWRSFSQVGEENLYKSVLYLD